MELTLYQDFCFATEDKFERTKRKGILMELSKKENVHTPKIKAIFIPAILLLSMLVIVDIEVVGIRLDILLLFALTIIYICFETAAMRKEHPFPVRLQHQEDVAVLLLLGWSLLCIIGKLLQSWDKSVPNYQFQVTCITLSFLYFLFKEVKELKEWYFDLVIYSGLLIMGYMLFCYLCNMQMAGIPADIMSDSGQAASYLLLPCVISVYRYCICRDRLRSVFYLLTAAVGFFTLLINRSIVSLWIMAAVFILIPIVMRPTAELVKKDMQLCFIFFFMMSNMSLLTNYTQLIQKETNWSLEHSVYIDLLIAVGGVLFFGYWDKIPKEIDKEKLVLRKMRRGYILTLKLMGLVFLSFVMGGDKWKALPDTMGTRIVSSFAVPLIDEIGNSRNIWISCMENSSISALAILILAGILIRRVLRNHNFAKPLTGGFLIVAAVVFMETFFLTPCVNVLPVYLLMIVMAAFYREDKQRVVVNKINIKEITAK